MNGNMDDYNTSNKKVDITKLVTSFQYRLICQSGLFQREGERGDMGEYKGLATVQYSVPR
jgi:hypothetical protein